MNRLFLAALLAALVLAACGAIDPFPDGSEVKIQSGAIGCRYWSQPDQDWVDCSQIIDHRAVGEVQNHPEDRRLGHAHNGRVRVQTKAFGPLWFEPWDLERVPEEK